MSVLDFMLLGATILFSYLSGFFFIHWQTALGKIEDLEEEMDECRHDALDNLLKREEFERGCG